MKLLKNIGNIIGWVVIFVLAGYIIINTFLPQYSIPIFGFKAVTVESDSMTGKFEIGDLVFITRVDEENLKEYDIITFNIDYNNDGKKDYVTHYFSSWVNDAHLAFKTRNEKSGLLDNWVISRDELVGSYVFHIQFVGHIINFIQSPIGLATIGVNIIIIGVIIYLVKVDKKNKKDTE
jgi:signal peptidase